MLGIFVDILVPVFLVVGAGFVLARTVGIKPEGLATLAYWVLGPVFIFDILSGADLEAGEVARIVAATVAAVAAVGVLAGVAGRMVGSSRSLTSATVLSSIHGNVGNFGLAIVAFALGEGALPIAGIVMVTINTVGILIGVGLATSREHHLGRAAWRALTTPLALAVVPALMVNMSNIELPLWFDRPVSLVAAAMIPVMLLTLGVQLAGMEKVMPSTKVGIPIAMKLIVNPVAAFVAVVVLGLTGTAADVVVLQAAMPAAVFTSLIALEHDLEPDFVTSVLLSGTLVSALTIPVVIALI